MEISQSYDKNNFDRFLLTHGVFSVT